MPPTKTMSSLLCRWNILAENFAENLCDDSSVTE